MWPRNAVREALMVLDCSTWIHVGPLGEETWDPDAEVLGDAEFISHFCLILNLFLPWAPPDGLPGNCLLFLVPLLRKCELNTPWGNLPFVTSNDTDTLWEPLSTTSQLASQPSFCFALQATGQQCFYFGRRLQSQTINRGDRKSVV